MRGNGEFYLGCNEFAFSWNSSREACGRYLDVQV